MIIARNWRDQIPYIGHVSAIIWPFFRGEDSDNPADMARLSVMNSFVKHGLQGRQQSDHHHHTNIEQMYFILRGGGEMLLGDDKHTVREGDAVYVPVNLPHQAFNESDDWMEHLIVSCPLPEIKDGQPVIRNWQDASLSSTDGVASSWPLLTAESDTEGGVLQRMTSVSGTAFPDESTSVECASENQEIVHYIVSGRGSVQGNDFEGQILEGSAVHVSPGSEYTLNSEGSAPLSYVSFAAEASEGE